MTNKKLLPGLIVCLLLAGGATYGFNLFSPPGKWLSGDLARNIEINQNGHSNVNDPDGGVTEIRDAIVNSWNAAVPGTITSTSISSNPPASIGDGISTMHFNVAGTGCSGGCLAVTFTPIATVGSEVVNGTSFGGFTDSDIFFNPSTKYYSDSEADGCRREFHIESVAVHEVGHLMGLDHTPVTSATMFASTGQCNAGGESLAQDDIDGINCIYNNGYGCGGCVEDTLVVDMTNCSQPSSGPNAGDFLVETFIVDNCGNAVADANVVIDIPISPSGPLSCSGTTSSTGRLGCALDNPADGLYESLVGDASKTGFNTWTGSECGGVGQPPCGCSIEIGGGGSCVPTSSKEKGPKCSDGLDNDCDGLIDGADPDC
jgi:hypothetical protein